MQVPKIYSNTFLSIIRISGIIAAILLAVSMFYRIINLKIITETKTVQETIFVIIQNSILIIPCILLVIFPEHLEIISFLSAELSVTCAVDYCNPMSPLMFFLSVTTLAYRGFYNKHKSIKVNITVIFYAILMLIDFRFGLINGALSFISKLAYNFIVFLSMLFFAQYYLYSKTTQKKILVISQFKDLSKRDAEWLELVRNGVKYDAIAIEYKLASSTVKNHLRDIYRILQVGDKQGFLSIYGDWKIVFEMPSE